MSNRQQQQPRAGINKQRSGDIIVIIINTSNSNNFSQCFSFNSSNKSTNFCPQVIWRWWAFQCWIRTNWIERWTMWLSLECDYLDSITFFYHSVCLALALSISGSLFPSLHPSCTLHISLSFRAVQCLHYLTCLWCVAIHSNKQRCKIVVGFCWICANGGWKWWRLQVTWNCYRESHNKTNRNHLKFKHFFLFGWAPANTSERTNRKKRENRKVTEGERERTNPLFA